MLDEQTKTYYRFLNNLRESGVTNMFGASPYLAEAYDLKRREAGDVLSAWMKWFPGEDGELN